MAPGVAITAARAAGTAVGSPVDDRYTTASGTSMATPHVASAAAILAGQHPDWPASRLKDALVSSVRDVGRRWYEQGGGRVDVTRLIGQRVIATGSLNVGWLHGCRTFQVTAALRLPATHVKVPRRLPLTESVQLLPSQRALRRG